ncbi:PREDICTED: fibrous sheath-interacting protein 2 [Chinchilla lanigera]|uniref:Fibrous sheath interacting protein 2 n=1 Tax=Chinchilla lanigera TaxID=34839 RepID=A0A8C2VSN1_CHILA|nr:PREDICTED: fibrous sheath-interacting protein 2 [Chinchilla lanigera]
MELYLGACAKVARGASSRTATSTLAADSRQCGDGAHKTPFGEVGAAHLLDLPLGVKLPLIPGTDPLFFTTNLSEKLFRPSYGFNLTDPYCRLLENQYKSLHDPHLKAYYRRKDILRRLKKGGYITSNNKIVCSLRELNKYRQYLTNLKLDFERNYVREQKMLARQLQRLEENSSFPECSGMTQFQNWLLHEGTHSIKDQEQLIRHRYLDMISKGLEQSERAAEEQRLLRMDREERRQREHMRRKLTLRRKIEEEWKTKEMLLLTKIAEDVKREQRLEQQRRKSRDERDRKKQALLEKKMAYHLQKMQETGFKEDTDKNAFEHSGQDGADFEISAKKKKKNQDDIKLLYSADDHKVHKEQDANTMLQHQSSSKNVTKKLTSIIAQPVVVQDNATEQKKDGVTTKRSSTCDEKGGLNVPTRGSIISAQPSLAKNNPRLSRSFLDAKEEKEIDGKPFKTRPSHHDELGPQTHATAPGAFSSPIVSNIQQNLLQNCVQAKVTSDELNSIIQNIMTWVVATVTSILYPAITRYEERLQNNTYPVSDDSSLSSDSSSFCSTCSEEFTYGSYTTATTKTFQAETCTFAVNVPAKKPTPPPHLKPPSAQVGRTVTGKTYHRKGEVVTSQLKYNKSSLVFSYPKLRSSKSDSQLLASLQRGPKKSKDATTETDGFVSPLLCDKKAKAMDELKNLKNIFVNFKCHLKGETKLILESIFQEIMSDLTQAIPSISSVTAEVFVDQGEPEKEDVVSSVDICSLASDIVENVFDRLESAVEKKCVEIFSQEDLSIDIASSLTASGEYFTSSNGKPSENSLPSTLEPMCNIADDMVHDILEKLMTLASLKQNEYPLEDETKRSYQPQRTVPTYTILQRASKKKSTPEDETANLIANEEIQNLMSTIFSQASLLGYIEEAVSTILGYIQTELNNERLIASEQTIVFLQLLDEIFTHLHHEPVKPNVRKSRRSTQRNMSDTKEKYRLTGTTVSTGAQRKRPFPRVNVPGMVFYSEDDNEEINNIVKNVIDSSLKEEKAKSPEQASNHWFTKANTSFECKRHMKPPTKPASRSQVAFHDWELKTELPPLINEDILREKHCLGKDISIFNQDQKHQIKKASEHTVKRILTEMLKGMASVSPGHRASRIGKETSTLLSETSQRPSHQEWMDQMFSVSEISAVAQEITDSVLNILFKASNSLSSPTKSSASSSVHQTFLDNSDIPHTAKEAPNKKPFKIWFDSDRKMKYLSSLDVDSIKPSWLKSGESEPKCVDNIIDKITNTVFKKLKLFVYPKLQTEFKTSSAKQSSLKSQLSTCTTKVVNTILDAIQNELECNKKNTNLRDLDDNKSCTSKGFLAGTDKKLESLIANLNDDDMESPLLTWICEMLLSGSEDQRNISLPSDKPRATTSHRQDKTERRSVLPSRQDKESFRQYLATPCMIHSAVNKKALKENASLQVLDRIGGTVHEMLNSLIGNPPDSQASFSGQSRENTNKDQQMAAVQKSNIQVISKTILDYILEKLCTIDVDASFASPELKAVSEAPDIDNLSFASIIEEMAKCTNKISSIISRKIQKDNKEVTKGKAKSVSSVSSTSESSKETHQNALTAVASDILNMVFTKLEGFANGNLETQGVISNCSTKDNRVDRSSAFSGTHEEPLESVLYMEAKKVSSAILKAIQTELNVNSDDLKKSVKKPSPETQMFMDIVNLILDVVSSDVCDETESKDRGIKTYRYQPTYGNFLPGGAESDSFLEDDTQAEKKNTRERTSLRQEAKFSSPNQRGLETSLHEIEMKLKEPHKSPILPIIKNILNEIFQSNFISQLNVLFPSHPHFNGMPHNVREATAQRSAQFMDKMVGTLVSESDEIIVASDIVRIVFHKLYTAAMTEENVSENRCRNITFSANVPFHEHTYGGNSITSLDRNLCTLQPRFRGDKQTKVNMTEDIIQAIFQKLENFTTSKIKSLFCSQVSFPVPEAPRAQQDTCTLSKALSTEDSYSHEQYSSPSMDPKTNSFCQISLSKLNIYAKEVARKILQGIKYELDKERESPLLTHNIVVSESIISQIVNTMLDIISCKNNNCEKENDSAPQEYIIEKLFNKSEYQKILQFQVENTVKDILCDIYEKTLYKNNLSFATPTLKYHIAGKRSEPNSEMFTKGANKIFPELSVPRSDVLLLSKEAVDIVLYSLASAAVLRTFAKDPAFAKSTFCDTFPEVEYQASLLMESKRRGKSECFPRSSAKKPTYADGTQTAVMEKEDTKQSVPDPCEESANFITKTIFNRLQTFATERMDSLITLAFQPKGTSFVGPELENSRQDDSVFHELSQVELDVDVLERSTTKTILSQELTEPTFASYREKIGATIHLPQASLKEYADIIASAILKLIKNDLDLEIQKIEPYPSNSLFQKNMIVSEIIDSVLKIIHNKISAEEISTSSEKTNFSQLTLSNEILLGHKDKEKNTSLSPLANYPLEQNQTAFEKESQRTVLEEIFMRSGKSEQKEKTELLRKVAELLNKLDQKVMEVIGHLLPLSEVLHSNSKIKTSDTEGKDRQSHISSAASDITECVCGKMYSVIVTLLYKNGESRGEGETPFKNDTLLTKSLCFRGTKQAGKRSNSPRCGIPEVCSTADSHTASVLGNTFLQSSPLQIGKDLMQIVLNKITNFVSLHLEENLSTAGHSEELQLCRLQISKASLKDSLKPGFKTGLKARSLHKFRAKPHAGPIGAKAKSKTKLSAGEKPPRDGQSKTAIQLPNIFATGDAKNFLEMKLPPSELNVYARDIISNILKAIMKELERVTQTRAMVHIKALPSDQILEASKIVNTVLQELYATDNHNLASPIKSSCLYDFRFSQRCLNSPAREQACFYLEDVSSQLEQIFPKEGIFKKMFDKWQADSNDVENEKYTLLTIAENALTEISIKAKDLEYSLSLLNLPLLEHRKGSFANQFKEDCSRAEDIKAQINMFGREIVEMLFEKLQLCFLSQMPTPGHKETLTNRKEHSMDKSKHGFPSKHMISSLPLCDLKTKDQISPTSYKQVTQEIVGRVLNLLESFVDLQFKHISKYEFSEIVKMPIDNLFQVQQRLLSKRMSPKLQPLKNFSDESKPSTAISKENIQNTLLQVHSFHSELLTYAVHIVCDMLAMIKSKLDKEIKQKEPCSTNILKENMVASEIIGTLMDQCTHFSESLIRNLSVESAFQGTRNTNAVEKDEFANNMKMPTPKLEDANLGPNLPQRNAPGLVFYSWEDTRRKYKFSSNLPSYVTSSVEDTVKSSGSLGTFDSETMSVGSRNKVQEHHQVQSTLGHFDEAMKKSSPFPEGSVLQKLFKKANDSTEASLKQVMSFIEMGKGENPRVFHYGTLKPVFEPSQIQTTVSPLRICLAAENIVNTVLSSYGFPGQLPTNKSMETMKPFFISKQNSLSEMSTGQKNKDKSLLRMWTKRISCGPEEGEIPEACGGDFSLLQKWQNKTPKIKKTETRKEVGVIAFADHELGPNEIHLIAMHVTTSVITYLKNFKAREKVSLLSTLSSKNCESRQPLRSMYSNSSVNQFCKHLSESVICHLISNISDSTMEGREKDKLWEIQGVAFNKIILIHSQVSENRSISIGELALRISEIVIEILASSNIVEAYGGQQMVSTKTKYTYCPGITSANFDDFFQDLLTGVIQVLSEEIGINHHFKNNGRHKPCSMLGSNNMSISGETNTAELLHPRGWESSAQQIDQLVQKNKLNYLTSQLDHLMGSLKTEESKNVVNKVFDIVLDLFLPDESPDGAVDSGKIARCFSSPNNPQSNSILRNNQVLSPKSVFLLNVVCEKLIRTLLEKCTATGFLDNGLLASEISTEVHQLLKILQRIENGDLNYCKKSGSCKELQRDCVSHSLENLAEMDQDLLSSDSMLTIISHSLVKSLMDKLSHSLQEAPECPWFENKYLNNIRREIQSNYTKPEEPELMELGQGKGSLGFMTYDSTSLTGSLNNPSVASSQMQVSFGKQCTVKSSSCSPLNRQKTKEMDAVVIRNIYQRDMNTGVYSATFLEEIISELFFHFSTSLWEKNTSITEAQLNEMNTLFVNHVVNEFNNAQVMVLRNAEERLYFPPIHKEMVRKIVDSVYYDVLHQYELKMTCGNNLACANGSMAQQITNGILLEILDYQLPSSLKRNLRTHSCYPLEAEVILQKLQSNLRNLTFQARSSKSYRTMLPHSFLEDVIRRLLLQLIPPSVKPSSLEKTFAMSSDFNELSTCITNKVMSAISKHRIWLTSYENQHLSSEKNLEKMVDSVYGSILQMSDSLVSIQRGILSRNPIMIDRIASFIIQEIIECHLQPFLCGEVLSHPETSLDAVSNMVKQVLDETLESHRSKKSVSISPDIFIGEMVAKLLSRIFSPRPNAEFELESMTQKIVNSVNQYFDKGEIHNLCNKKSLPSIDVDMVDGLVTSVYRNVLNQYGLDPNINKEADNGDLFVENITNLIVEAISNYLLHPLFSGDLSPSSYSTLMAENIVEDVLDNLSQSARSNQRLPPYDTLLPYTFLDDMIRVLLARFFPAASGVVPYREMPKEKSKMNFNEIASNLITDIRVKISQHEIQFSKDEEKNKFVYSEDDVQHLVDSVFKNILHNSESQESVEQNIASTNDVLIDRIAGFIIKHVCEQHLQPFLVVNSSSPSYTPFHKRQQSFYASAYSSTFLEDVVSGVLRKIFHRVVGIVQVTDMRDSEDELFDKAEELIHFITEEFSKAQVTVIENAEKQLRLPPVEKDIVKSITDTVYSRVLEEYEMEIWPRKDFLSDTRTLAARITTIILTEILDFQIRPNLVANLSFKSHSKLSENVLIRRVHCDISKSRFRRQASTIYTTLLSQNHLERIVTQLVSQIDILTSTTEHPGTSQSDLSDTVMKLINEIMTIISKNAICITKQGNEKQNMIPEKDIQSMIDSIYSDLSHSNVYQSLTKDKKGLSNIPVSKIASFIIKEIFNHHLQSFLSGDNCSLPAPVDHVYKENAMAPKRKRWSCIVNSTVFLEEVISELLCKLLYAFSHNVLAFENPDTAKAQTADIVTALVKSIVLEFTASEILVADNLDKDMCFSEEYKEMIRATVNLIYEKLLDEYKSLIQVYRAMQSDTTYFGRKIYHLLLEEIYDYQVQSLISGELVSSSCSSLQADNIVRNVLGVILSDNSALPSCVTVFPRALLEDMIYKLLAPMFPPTDTENKLTEEELTPDDDFAAAASTMTDEIIKEIFEHEIRLATAVDNAESTQLEVLENLVDSICNNILRKPEFQAEVQKDAGKKGGSFLSKIAGFIMKEIMDHHLRPFLHGEESPSSHKPGCDHASVVTKSGKGTTQASLFSATFLEDLVVDLVRKFFSFPAIKDSKKRATQEPDIVGLAIKFVNALLGEFRKKEIKVLPQAEEKFSFPPIDKEIVADISSFVYDQFIGKFGSNDIQKDGKSNFVVEMIAALAQKAISAFKIQPLFSGDWSSTFFSFLNPDTITQRVQHLPQNTSMQITRYSEENQLTLQEQSHKQTALTSDQKKMIVSLDQNRGAMSRKNSHTKDLSGKKEDIQNPVLTSGTTMVQSNVITLRSGPSAGRAHQKKEDKNKPGSLTPKSNKRASGVTSPATHKNRKEQDLSKAVQNHALEKTKRSIPKNAESQGSKTQTPFKVVSSREYKDVPEFQTDSEKNRDKAKESSIKGNSQDVQLSSWKPTVKHTETTKEETLKTTQKPRNEAITDSLTDMDTDDQISDYETVQNIIENIYGNVLVRTSLQEPSEFPKYRHKSFPGYQALNVIQEPGTGSTQSVKAKSLPPSVNKEHYAKKTGEKMKERQREEENKSKQQKENEKTTEDRTGGKEVRSKATETDHPQYLPESKPGVFPANFLEDVLTEVVNKLLFSSSPEAETSETYPNVNDSQNQTELYDTAMKLFHSLIKEFSDAQIEVFRPDEENTSFPHASKVSSVPTAPSRNKESTTDEALSGMKVKNMDKRPDLHKVTAKLSSPEIPLLEEIPSIDKTLANKVAHSSICNILKEYKSQESLCQHINSNGENLVKRLASAVINELFQHQLNLVFCDEAPGSACLPLDSKDLVKKVQKATQTASKECQTTSPYTVMLPHQFLEDVISTLLSKIFSKISDTITKAEIPENKYSTEFDFLQMELVSKIAAEISKDENMIVQYVESLHPNDDEIIELVVQSIYNNLLPQFGSQEVIQNCVSNGCRLLSETIVDLVLKEVAGNQLQNYFCGELTPHQCAEVDNVVESILFNIIQTTTPPPPHAHKVSYNIIEEIAVKFLSKLLSVFPKVHKKKSKSRETEMQKITSKILNSFQEFFSRSKIRLTRSAKESPTVSLDDSETIEKIVDSVYTSVLKHSGSYTSVFKDLMGQSNVLSDIIGFLMVNEISNCEFQPQVEEEIPTSELILEAVKIMEKVLKIVDKLKSQENFLSEKCFMLDANVLEEALALFLAKLLRSPRISSQEAHNLSKPDLNKIASQLTKSVTAEVSRSNISLVASEPEECSSNLEEMHMISQVIDSVYGDMLQQAGSHEELYDLKDANTVFSKVASLIIDGVSRVPLDRGTSKSSYAGVFEDLDIDRIIEKTEKHAEKMMANQNESDEGRSAEERSVVIIPHVGKKAIKVDPHIISQHLAVISVKTEPLEKMKTECLRRTGQSIEELRQASVNGRSYAAMKPTDLEERRKERRTSLNSTGRLDVKPFEAVCRNSFQNVRKPDISKVELLKDVRNRKDLIIRLVAHDINQEDTDYFTEDDIASDQNEVVLGEYFGQKSIGELSEDEVKEVMKLIQGRVAPSKPTTTTDSMENYLSPSRHSQPTSASTTKRMEAASNQIESNKTQGNRAAGELHMATSKSLSETHPSTKKKSHHKRDGRSPVTEPAHHFIHRIMSTSSYNQEDLLSSSSEEDSDTIADTKLLKACSLEQKPDNSTGIQFISIFEESRNTNDKALPSKETIAEAPKPSISKQGSKMLARVSSTLSKVFSRSHTNVPKSSSPPHQNEH